MEALVFYIRLLYFQMFLEEVAGAPDRIIWKKVQTYIDHSFLGASLGYFPVYFLRVCFVKVFFQQIYSDDVICMLLFLGQTFDSARFRPKAF